MGKRTCGCDELNDGRCVCDICQKSSLLKDGFMDRKSVSTRLTKNPKKRKAKVLGRGWCIVESDRFGEKFLVSPKPYIHETKTRAKEMKKMCYVFPCSVIPVVIMEQE